MKAIIFILLSLSVFAVTQQVEYGKASYYADHFQGKKTASGELYHPDSLTAAHKTLPFGSKVKVTNTKNDIYVIVRVNDRGPYIDGRIIDLSRNAMEILKGLDSGLIQVKVEVLNNE